VPGAVNDYYRLRFLAVADVSADRRTSPNPVEQRLGRTTAFTIGDLTGILTTTPAGEDTIATTFDLRVGKHGSTLAGLTDALAAAASLALQHGTPLEEITDAWQQTRFVPNGTTDDLDIPDTTSLADYVARRLRLDSSPIGTRPTAAATCDSQILR
jgi:hypothetical protein